MQATARHGAVFYHKRVKHLPILAPHQWSAGDTDNQCRRIRSGGIVKWRGIRRQSLDVASTAEDGLLAINSRFKVAGELRRRRALARSSIQRKNAAVTNISGFSAFQSNVMAALTDGDRIQGYANPYALWGDNPDYTVRTYPVPRAFYTFNGTQVDSTGNGADHAVAGSYITGPGSSGDLAIKGTSTATSTKSYGGTAFGTGDMAMCGWVEIYASSGRNISFGFGTDGSPAIVFKEKVSAFLEVSGSYLSSSYNEVQSAGWHHVAVSCSTVGFTYGTASIFVDGVLVSTIPLAFRPATESVTHVRCSTGGPTTPESGICDFGLFDSTLSLGQVNSIMDLRA